MPQAYIDHTLGSSLNGVRGKLLECNISIKKAARCTGKPLPPEIHRMQAQKCQCSGVGESMPKSRIGGNFAGMGAESSHTTTSLKNAAGRTGVKTSF